MEQVFCDTSPSPAASPDLARHILTLLLESHSSYANIQICLRRLLGVRLSIGTIATVVQQAQDRALQWMATRALALDEIYANNRCGVYLNVVDTDSWAVWAA